MNGIAPLRLGPGVGAATGAASATLAVPTTAGGSAPENVYITADTFNCYVRAGLTGDTVTNATGAVVPANGPGLLLNVKGCTHIIHLQGSGGAGRICVSPVEA